MKVSSPVIGNSDLTQDKLYLNVSSSVFNRHPSTLSNYRPSG